MRSFRLTSSFYGGIAVIAFGLCFAAVATNFSMGSMLRPGSGLFPLVVGILLVLLGTGVVFGALTEAPEEEVPDAEPSGTGMRPLICATLSIIVFAQLLERVGFIPSAFVMILIAAAGKTGRNWPVALLLAAGTALAGGAIFVWGLSLPIPLIGSK